MVDDTDPRVESDLRRRAAWLLVMLAVVAVLFVIIISAIVKTSKHGNNAGPGPLDRAATGSSATQSPTTHPSQHPSNRRSTSQAVSRSHSSSSSSPAAATTSCPGMQACILDGDVGNTIARINDYRSQHGLPAVQGTVSPRAQTCALNNGSGCSGSWAETFLADPNGQLAVTKILPFAHLDDPQVKSVGVGWAYSPEARTYYYAVVRGG